LPLPETPVITTKSPSGIFKFIFFKLFPLAPYNVKKNLEGFLLVIGIGIYNSPRRYLAVNDLSLNFSNSFGLPYATT